MASTQVRLHPTTKAYLDLRKAKINKARAKAKKKDLTLDDIIAIALDGLTDEQAVAK